MHSTTFTTFVFANLYAGICLAAPTELQTPSQGKISTIVGQLDSHNKLDWTPVGDGGRVATIPAQLVSSVQQNTGLTNKTLAIRDGTSADVGRFTNIGRISNIAASYACEKGGAYGVSSTIETSAKQACKQFLQTLPAAPVAENAWRIYQGAAQPGADGNEVSTIFRWFYNSAAAPALTDTMCNTAYQYLTTTFCQGKGGKGAATRGGEIKIGDGDDYTMIGFDPNDA